MAAEGSVGSGYGIILFFFFSYCFNRSETFLAGCGFPVIMLVIGLSLQSKLDRVCIRRELYNVYWFMPVFDRLQMALCG